MPTFAERLSQLIAEREYKNNFVADRVGLEPSTIGRYCDGTLKEPGLTRLSNLAELFDVSLDYLTGRSDNRWTGSEELFVKMFKDLPSGDRQAIIRLLNSLVERNGERI